jgi:DNA-binding NarL/FixJ family response regulator
LIRVFIVAQAVAVREGLRSLLLEAEQVHVIGEASNLDSQENLWADTDVVIWSPSSMFGQDEILSELKDIQPGGMAGLLLIHEDPRAIEILSKHRLRAWGIISPEFSRVELLAGITAINEGLVVVNPIWMQDITSNQRLHNEDDSEMVEPLTGREGEILQLLALGLTNKQIAHRLGISAHTVKFHVSSIFAKMQTTNRTETVKLGLKMGLIAL